jgi:radical SAM protein with 4Fe4S-binding SPASM domain
MSATNSIWPGLSRAGVYPVPAGDWFGLPEHAVFMVYSPLAYNLIFASPDGLDSLEAVALNSTHSREPAGEVLKQLIQATEPQKPVYDPDKITKLSVIPNYDCNFSCSYCYAAGSHSDQSRLPFSVLKDMLDWFIDPQRLASRDLFISFLGGGEPALAWDVVRAGIEYARKRSRAIGFRLGIGFTTNGSVLNQQMLDVLKANFVTPGVSFEVLEDVQNLQRGNYRLVRENIFRMLDYGLHPLIKPNITSANVSRLVEMVEHLSGHFPGVRQVKLQPVDDPQQLDTPEILRKFYNDFIDNYFRARELGLKSGIDVYCLNGLFTDAISGRFCEGEYCLVPDGRITVCHRVSWPGDPDFGGFCYGCLSANGKPSFDETAFSRLMHYDAYNREDCRNCFARWHCGGGCLAQASVYRLEMLDEVCRFTREITRQSLLRKVKSAADAEKLQCLVQQPGFWMSGVFSTAAPAYETNQ